MSEPHSDMMRDQTVLAFSIHDYCLGLTSYEGQRLLGIQFKTRVSESEPTYVMTLEQAGHLVAGIKKLLLEAEEEIANG